MKKINFNTRFFIVSLLLLVLSSCSLDISPKDDDDFTSEDYFSNTDSYKQFLAKI